MTQSRAFKRLVRERMAATGLSYSTARQQILGNRTREAGPPIIAFVGLKGGIGRTTLALVLGAELVGRGHRVLVVEVVYPGYEPQFAFGRYWEANCRLSGFSGPQFVEFTAEQLSRGALDRFRGEFDVIFIDPFNDSGQQYAAMMLADVAIVPATHDAYGAVGRLLNILPFLAQQRVIPDTFIRGVLIRDPWPGRYREEAIEETMVEAGVPLLEARLDDREAYRWFSERGLPLSEIHDSVSAMRAAGDVAALLEELFPGRPSEAPWRSGTRRVSFRFQPPPMGPSHPSHTDRLRTLYESLMSIGRRRTRLRRENSARSSPSSHE